MKQWHKSDRIFFVLYCFWIAIGLAVGPLHITDQTVGGWPFPGFLIGFIEGCLRYGDPILIVLAAINTHLLLVRTWGSRPARRFVLSVVVLSAVIETAGTLTGWPFGHYAYTDNFGPRLWVLPLAIPLAWFVLIGNALILWRSLLPGFIITIEAAAAATLVTGIDWVMEPFAAQLKLYWLWGEATVPWTNYVAWWVITFLLVHLFAKTPGHQGRTDPRPPVILGTMLALFIVTRALAGV
jgi:uncharacterized membrane protein